MRKKSTLTKPGPTIGDSSLGRVVWITGLAGSGKTTIARLVVQGLRTSHPHTIFLDGDELRQVLGDLPGFSLTERRRLAAFYGRLCRLLSEQGINIVIATISMFEDRRQWNRQNIERYIEIYLRVPAQVLQRRRDARPLSIEGPVVGVDLSFEEPLRADLVLNNDDSVSPEVTAERILQYMQEHWSC